MKILKTKKLMNAASVKLLLVLLASLLVCFVAVLYDTNKSYAEDNYTSATTDYDSIDKAEIDGINYELDSSNYTATIIGRDNKITSSVKLSSKVEFNKKEYTVIKIESSAFCKCTELRSITIPSSIKYIESSAFEGCTNLTEITFNGNKPIISQGAFQGLAFVLIYPDNSEGWNTDDIHLGMATRVIYSKMYNKVSLSGAITLPDWEENQRNLNVDIVTTNNQTIAKGKFFNVHTLRDIFYEFNTSATFTDLWNFTLHIYDSEYDFTSEQFKYTPNMEMNIKLPNYHTLSGCVKNTDGVMSNTQIELIDIPSGKVIDTCKTDAYGNYSFKCNHNAVVKLQVVNQGHQIESQLQRMIQDKNVDIVIE